MSVYIPTGRIEVVMGHVFAEKHWDPKIKVEGEIPETIFLEFESVVSPNSQIRMTVGAMQRVDLGNFYGSIDVTRFSSSRTAMMVESGNDFMNFYSTEKEALYDIVTRYKTMIGAV